MTSTGGPPEVVVHGKGRRESRLPLPTDVGEAITAWLQRGRPKTTSREVYLSVQAPIASVGHGGVSSIVRRACVRAGVAPFGPQRLRHTRACEMVSAGVPMAEIGQVLRHRSFISTAIYARVDLNQRGDSRNHGRVGRTDERLVPFAVRSKIRLSWTPRLQTPERER